MTVEADCPFCEIVRRETPDTREVYRDEHVVAFFPVEPATLGHTLVVPRDHIPDVWSLDEEAATRLAHITLRLSHAVKSATEPEGLNIIQSNGVVATQTVPHLHVHLVPRWSGDGMGPIWPSKTSYPEAQKDDVWQRLRSECRKVGGK
ncbi:histidine triad (HIT) family protein [Micromonospora coriariae]|uniref:Histidine triad (HIT) family protein n=2 Tax=Micromonospora coriariae TaxID=285665 RepID=A0A1C4W0P2_9ACTN|nr:histidine triad (HIT) family protein [Micromonospora coriariae]